MDWSKGLTLVLHTPGGITNATQTIVEYLKTKFGYIEVLVPAYAMSAGTMICFAANAIVMGRQSQLGPIDPQMFINGRMVSARSIVDQFKLAKKEILENNANAAIWYPMLQSIGPAILQEAFNALEYSERMAADWLKDRMFANKEFKNELAEKTAEHFNDASHHKSHGRRIGREEARVHNLQVEDLEDDQELQDAVLSAYHVATIIIEQSPATKLIIGNHGKQWVKNLQITSRP